MSGGARPVRHGLDRVLRSLGGPSAAGLQAVVEQWPQIVGERAAARSEPLVVESDRLVVGAQDSATAEELRWREAEIAGRVAEFTGEAPARVEVRVRPP